MSKASFLVNSPECPARKITKVTDNIFILATEKIIHPQKHQKQGNWASYKIFLETSETNPATMIFHDPQYTQSIR